MQAIRTLSLALLVLGIHMIYAPDVYAYQITYFIQDNASATPSYIIAPPMLNTDSCTAVFQQRVSTVSGSSYDISTEYYNPGFTTIFTHSPPTLSGNLTCAALGGFVDNSDTLQNYLEPKIKDTYSASTLNAWMELKYICNPGDDDLFIYTNTTHYSSDGNHPYAYRFQEQLSGSGTVQNRLHTTINDAINNIYLGFYSQNCSTTNLLLDTNASYTNGFGGTSSTIILTEWLIVPVNPMGSGLLNVTVSDVNKAHTGNGNEGHSRIIALWRPDNNNTQILNAQNWTGAYPVYSDTIIKTPYINYWLLIGTELRYTSATNDHVINYIWTDYNITIFAYEPEWVCGDYGECSGGIKSKICIDPLGKLPNQIQSISCLDSTLWQFDLGFEEYYNDSVYWCGLEFALGCSPSLQTTGTQFPVNWTIVTTNRDFNGHIRENFARVTDESAYNGSRSLKLWYTPPILNQPVSDPANSSLTICGNLTSGRFAEASHPYNATLFISSNITFPAPYTDLRLHVRKCDNVPVQYDYLNTAIHPWLNWTCGKGCYGTCDTNPYGTWGLKLTDNDNGLVILDESNTLSDDLWHGFVYVLDGKVTAGRNYTLSLAINPFDSSFPYSHCIYIDNVRVTIRDAEITCEDSCDGLKKIVSSKRLDGGCTFTTIDNHPDCAETESDKTVLQQLISGEITEGCINGILYKKIDGEIVGFGESPACQSIEEEEEESDIYQSDSWLYYIFGIQLGAFDFLFTTVATGFYICLIFATGVGAKTKHWQGFVMTLAAMITLFSIGGIFDWYFGFAIVVIGVVLFANTVSKASGSGG